METKSFAKTIAIGVLILGLAGLYFGKMTGTSGGEIRHTEIRAGFDGNQSLTPENNSGEQNDD